MARVEPVPVNQWPPQMREALAAMTPPEPRHGPLYRKGRPKGLNALGTYAHHPALARAYFTFNGHALLATTLSERQRELILLRVAALRDCRYMWAQHTLIGPDTGLSETEIARIALGPDAQDWDPLDAAMLRAVDELIADATVSETTWADLAAVLDTQQLMDLIASVGAFETTTFLMRALAFDLDDDLLAAQIGPAKD
ncbi:MULTISPECIES: carboxymuconolactone decarboxylase family protein [Pseudofrankia]|uniref:carboxymuconolactone decarboxylase family protein n=1 Tax=Pseudofrankia TaxID=2994363 RepID=UPI000234C4AA|nr:MULTISPECIES: carboxymuconolactone decarboxylase family protein [Pseudofrankia]OHV29179.1 carboxymuconolactone decarboxylase [Pseudofrankia sp. EUN1h]